MKGSEKMAEIKEYLDLEGLTHAVEKVKEYTDGKDAESLKSAKDYADGLSTNYDAAGTATTKVKELEDGQVKTNKEAISKLNGDETVVGSVAKSVKDAKTELEGKIKASTYNDTELKGKVTAVEIDITTLKGTGDGSIKKQIDDAFNDFSTKVTDDSVVNTYKELIDYAAAHKGEAATMAGDISKNAEAIKTLETYVGKLPEGTDAKTVIDYINNKIEGTDQSSAIEQAKQAAINAAATDATTKASTAETNAKAYADGLAKNYATSDQGTKADSALQKADIISGTANGAISVKGIDVAVKGLGDAAFSSVADYEKAGAVSKLEAGQVATNKSNIEDVTQRVQAIENVQYTPITNDEIDTLFTVKAN